MIYQETWNLCINLLCIIIWYSLEQGQLSLSRAMTEAEIYTKRVLQTIQMKLILLCVWAEPAILGSTKTALMWSACHEKSYLTNLEIRNLKSAVSALCGCLSFACFEKKWGKVL